MDTDELIVNLDRLHTTELGVVRIRKNLSLPSTVEDVVAWCRDRIRDDSALITRAGKNWYIEVQGCRITVNAHSFTIITAHEIRK